MYTKCVVLILMTLVLSSCGDGLCPPSSAQCSLSSVGPVEPALTFPSSKRTIWVDDESSMRTVSFTHDATSVECSRDGGSSFSACDSNNSIVWTTADYNQQHQVKFNRTSGVETLSFTPSSTYPGVTFVSCDEEVTTDEDFTTFDGRTGSSKVICISDGVTISNTGAHSAITLASNDITIIARHNQTATFTSTRNSGSVDNQSILKGSGFNNTRFVGLRIEHPVAAGVNFGIELSGQNNLVDSVTSISSATTGSTNILINVNDGGTTAHTIKNFTADGGTKGVAIAVNLSDQVNISDSTISGGDHGLQVLNFATVTLSNSTISINTSTTAQLVSVRRADLTMSNVTLNDGTGNATEGTIFVDADASTTNLNLADVNFKRTTDNSGSTNNAIKINTGGTVNINATNNNNSFCAVAPGTVTYGSVLAEGHTGSFVVGNQVNGGAVGTCN